MTRRRALPLLSALLLAAFALGSAAAPPAARAAGFVRLNADRLCPS